LEYIDKVNGDLIQLNGANLLKHLRIFLNETSREGYAV